MRTTLLHSGEATSRVASLAMERLRDIFEDKAKSQSTTIHSPSAEQWSALEAIITCLDTIVLGAAEPVMYLSSLDPGIGKSSALIAFLDVLLAQQDKPYRDCGVLVATNTLEEVQRFVTEVGIPKDMLGVWTSDKDLNSLGASDVTKAQVLITTHERVSRELKDCEVWAAESLYFNGERRRLRVWDEAFLPGHPISLNVDDVLSVIKVLRSISTPLRDDIKATFDEIEKLPDGAVHQIPDFLQTHGVDLNDLLEAANALDPRDEIAKSLNETQSEIVTSLALVSGKTVKVRQDGRYGNASVNYRETFPEDLAPMLILDASGRPGIRVMYDDMEQSRKLVRRLKSAHKNYGNLQVHLWQTGGGKSAWKENSKTLLEGIIAAILSKPDEEWLILHHKAGKGVPDIPKEVTSRLSSKVSAKVHFLNLGKHKATNKFSHVTNIIKAGVLYLRPSQYEARKRLASGVPPEAGDFSKHELERFALGEHADNILQGVCRGGVRKSQGDTCPPCDVYLIASVHSKIGTALPSIFPGCTVTRWKPFKVSFKGTAGRALKLIEAWAATANSSDKLFFSDISEKLGVSKRDFKAVRREHKGFRDEVAALGLTEWGKNIYFTAYVKT